MRTPHDRSAAPVVEERFSLGESFAALAGIFPVLVLGLAVFGGLFGGVFTPTEAGAVGAAIALLIALFRGRLT
jgi:TRAP-type C4-dicarboxylate transport system permease large subunit